MNDENDIAEKVADAIAVAGSMAKSRMFGRTHVSAGLFVKIDTDGAVKKNDTLKSSPLGDAFHASWALGRQPLARIAVSQEFMAYHQAQRPSSAVCQACPRLKVCGGGMVTHRFKEGSEYDNPTVFCADQKRLIARMEEYLAPLSKGRAA
jgi:radical SAM protein with 4Fe4S-binding SPASM domain